MALTRFSLRQLEAFTTIAEMHSFSAAAERLGLTSSAVSQLVAELESLLGFRLFDRTTRRVALSSAGSDFLVYGQSVLRHADAAESAASDVRLRAAGIVRIGAPLVLASMVLPEAIRDYGVHRPKVVVRIHDVAVDRLVECVADADVDLCVGPDRVVPEAVQRTVVFDSRWVLWCTPTHPLAARRSVRWSRLRDVPLVASGRDHERSVAQMRVQAPADARITPVHVVDNLTTAFGIAAQGQVLTLAPEYVGVMASHFGLVMRRVVEPETVRQVCVYKSAARAVSPAAQGFFEFLVDWLPSWAKRARRKPELA